MAIACARGGVRATTAAATTTAVTAAIHTEIVRRTGASGICVVVEVASSFEEGSRRFSAERNRLILRLVHYADKESIYGIWRRFR